MKNILAIIIPVFLLITLYYFISKQDDIYNYDIVLCDSTIIMSKNFEEYKDVIIITDCAGDQYYFKSDEILSINKRD